MCVVKMEEIIKLPVLMVTPIFKTPFLSTIFVLLEQPLVYNYVFQYLIEF